MKFNLLGVVFIATFSALALSSCSVDQDAALFSFPAATGDSEKTKKTTVKTGEKSDWATRMEEAKKKREEAKALAEKEKAAALALKEKEAAAKLVAKKKADALEARKLAAIKKKEDAAKLAEEAEKKALAEQKAKDKAAAEAARKLEIAEAKEQKERARAARIAAKRKAELERDNREALEASELAEAETGGSGSNGGGFFSFFSVNTPSKYKSDGHHINVNQKLLGSLNANNAEIEIDISEQRARIYKASGGHRHLVIETQVSTGKSGHSTSPGTFRIKEKLVAKRSTLYGHWVNSSGSTVSSSGDSRSRPRGGSRFVGAEMPYWMRINGGIGMHIGYVPDYPASHGCIRVPPAIQPLIFSKVGVGTPVTIKR